MYVPSIECGFPWPVGHDRRYGRKPPPTQPYAQELGKYLIFKVPKSRIEAEIIMLRQVFLILAKNNEEQSSPAKLDERSSLTNPTKAHAGQGVLRDRKPVGRRPV
jgi:hypothetical protein